MTIGSRSASNLDTLLTSCVNDWCSKRETRTLGTEPFTTLTFDKTARPTVLH